MFDDISSATLPARAENSAPDDIVSDTAPATTPADTAPARDADELPMTWADAFPWLGSGALWKDEPIDVANDDRLHDVVGFIAGTHSVKRLADCFPFISPEFELTSLTLPNTVARNWASKNYSVFADVATLRVRSIGDIPQVGDVMQVRALTALAAENVCAAMLQEHVGNEIARAVGTRDVAAGCTFAEPFVVVEPGAGAAAVSATTAAAAAPATWGTFRDTKTAVHVDSVGAVSGAAAAGVAADTTASPAQPRTTVPASVTDDVTAVTQWLVNVGKAALPIDTPGLFDGMRGPAADALDRLRATPLVAWTNQADYTDRFSRRVAAHVARLRDDQLAQARRAVNETGDARDTAQASVWIRGMLAEFISADGELSGFITSVVDEAADTPLVDLVSSFPVLTDVVAGLDAPLWQVVAWLSSEFDRDGTGFDVRRGRCVVA